MYPIRTTYTCLWCPDFDQFPSRSALHLHKARKHPELYGAGNQDVPWDVNDQQQDPFNIFPHANNVRDIYFDNTVYILQPHRTQNPMIKIFNFPLANGRVTDQNVEDHMNFIYQHPDVQNAYRLNIAAGVILLNRSNNTYRFFRAAGNVFILDQPLRVWNKASLKTAIRELQELNIDEIIRNFRNSSSYSVIFISNVEYYVYTSSFPLRGPLTFVSDDNIPDFIKKNAAIISRFNNINYANLCVFVAIAQHKNPEQRADRITSLVKQYFNEWVTYHNSNFPFEAPILYERDKFKGLKLEQISTVQECFKMNINVMELRADGSVITKVTSATNYNDTMFLNLYKSHVNLIRADKIDIYAKAYVCRCVNFFFFLI